MFLIDETILVFKKDSHHQIWFFFSLSNAHLKLLEGVSSLSKVFNFNVNPLFDQFW